MNPKISIIIPVYNVENYINKCMDSVINQTLEDIEILCIDDGSTDNSLNILKEYAKKDNRITIYTQNNKGPGSSRNLGLDNAKGEYIQFVDSDDWIDIDTSENLYNESKKYNLDLLLFQIMNYDESKNKFYQTDYYNNSQLPSSFDDEVFNYKDISEYGFSIIVPPFSKFYKRSLLEKYNIRFPTGLYFEDNPFHWEVLLASERIKITRNHYSLKRGRSDSITAQNDVKILDTVKISNLVVEAFQKYDSYEPYKKQILNNKIWYLKWCYDNLQEKYKEQYFKLLHEDFTNIENNLPNIHKDLLNNLNDFYKKFYLDVSKTATPLELKMLLKEQKEKKEQEEYLKKIEDTKKQLNNKQEELNNKQEELNNKEKQLNNKQEELNNKEKQLNNKQEELNNKEKQLNLLNKELLEKTQSIDEKNSNLQIHENMIREKEEKLLEFNNTFTHDVKEFYDKINRKESLLNNLLDSHIDIYSRLQDESMNLSNLSTSINKELNQKINDLNKKESMLNNLIKTQEESYKNQLDYLSKTEKKLKEEIAENNKIIRKQKLDLEDNQKELESLKEFKNKIISSGSWKIFKHLGNFKEE